MDNLQRCQTRILCFAESTVHDLAGYSDSLHAISTAILKGKEVGDYYIKGLTNLLDDIAINLEEISDSGNQILNEIDAAEKQGLKVAV